MSLTRHYAGTHLGLPGEVTVRISAVRRGSVSSPHDVMTDGSCSIGALLRAGNTTGSIPNPYTGMEELLDYREMLDAHPDIDPDEAYTAVEFEFRYDHSLGPKYARDLQSEMRAAGYSEEVIEGLIAFDPPATGSPERDDQ